MTEEAKTSVDETATADGSVSFTEVAAEKVREFIAGHEQAEGKPLRVYVQGGPTGYNYGFTFEDQREGDEVIPQEGFDLIVDGYSLELLAGSTVDFEETLTGGGFVVNNPNEPDPMSDPLYARVKRLIDEQINPGVGMHGGFVTLLDVKEGTVYVKLGGGCQGCGMVDVTLKQGIERLLKEEIPEIQRVLDTTDHAAGENPYYQQ
jgi:Fe/S biogenesis protein NfuA